MNKHRFTLVWFAVAIGLSPGLALSAVDCARAFERLNSDSNRWEEIALIRAAKSAGKSLRLLFGPTIPRAKPVDPAWLESAMSILQAYAVPTGKALLPFPLPKTWGRGEVYAVFRKVWVNPDGVLSEADRAVIAAHEMTESLEEFRTVIRANPRSVQARKILEGSAQAALGVGTAAGVIHFVAQAQNEVVSSQQFLNEPQYRIGDWQIQLINETVPFPHLALRMGQRVYSYGETHMTVNSVVQYFEEQRFIEIWKKQNRVDEVRENPPKPSKSSRSLSSSLLRVGEATGLSSLPRSVQVVTLNLKPEEYRSLKSYLEDQTGKRYHNVTFVNDCATMIVRALEKNTSFRFSRVLDASPSQIVMALSVMKMAGDSRVDSVRLVAMDRAESAWSHLFRNLYINTMESKIFITSFLLNQGWRAWIDAMMNESELQSYDDEVREVIEKKWREETDAFMKMHRKVQPVFDALEAFEKTSSSDPSRILKAKRTQELLESIWQELEEKESARAANQLEGFQAKTLARYRLEWLEATRARILQELGIPTTSLLPGAPES